MNTENNNNLSVNLIRCYREHHMADTSRVFEFGYGELRFSYGVSNLEATDPIKVEINSPEFFSRGNERHKLYVPPGLTKSCESIIYATWDQMRIDRENRRKEVLGIR